MENLLFRAPSPIAGIIRSGYRILAYRQIVNDQRIRVGTRQLLMKAFNIEAKEILAEYITFIQLNFQLQGREVPRNLDSPGRCMLLLFG